MRQKIAAMLCAVVSLTGAPAVAELTVPMTYLRVETPVPPTLSNLDPIPEDLGHAGAQLGLADNQSSGRFLGQSYAMETVSIAPDADYLAPARAALGNTPLLILDAPAAAVTAIADLPEAQEALIFNVAAEEETLREAECRANLLHTIPTQAMRADALMQFFVSRRWDDLVMIHGAHDPDMAFAEALRNAATKFGLSIRAEKPWTFDADMRRNAAQEVPLFTQDFGEHEVLLVADETGDFARYIPFNTWLPRPVAGSEGLVPAGWSAVIEAWGAAQLQSRFHDLAGRDMRSRDYAAWAAVRSIGEAVTRSGTSDVASLRAYILGPGFELAGFKGRPLTYRPWNGQLRQPIALVHRGALVAQAPLEGFLHRVNELDTLGRDEPETACTNFKVN